MREVLPALLAWWSRGDAVAVGTVVRTWRSAPRPAGACMLVGPDHTVVGSVSGGCVEGAVYEHALRVLGGEPPQVHRFGVTDDDAFAVGLTCGGTVEVFVERIDPATLPELRSLAASVDRHEPVALVTVITGRDDQVGRHLVVRAGDTEGSLGSRRLQDAVRDDARGQLAAGHSGTLTYGPDGQRRGEGLQVFVSAFAPRPRMLVFGAIDFAAAVARQGALLGYRVTVCDARAVFATRQRFPDADEVVVDWPHRYLQQQIADGLLDTRTVLCVLTHDPKFDVPLLAVALRLTGQDAPAYIGAMGSRRTHEDREARLRAEGLGDDELTRLSSPIGLDLGARTPQETAVSIAAEIIARRWRGAGMPLSETVGAIHSDPMADPDPPAPPAP